MITTWNVGAARIYGYTAEEVVGKPVSILVPPDHPDEMPQLLERVSQGESVEHYETVRRRKDGKLINVSLTISPVRDASGRVLASTVARDITERKQAEESLHRLNREVRAISNCNQVLLRATDEQRLLQEICRIVCEDAGYPLAWVGYAEHDEAQSVRPVAWTGAEEGYLATAGATWADTERGRGPTGTAIRTGKASCIQDYATDPRVASWREGALQRGFRSGIALPLKDEDADTFGSLTIHSAQPNAFTPEEIRLLEELAGDLAFGIATLRSRGARKQAEQEVALLGFALDKVREAAFLIDEHGRFHYVNEEPCRILGYTREELLAMDVWDIDADFSEERWSDHWRDVKAQPSLSFESRHRTRDGRIFPVEISANYFEYGGLVYNLALVRDITEPSMPRRRWKRKGNEWKSSFLPRIQDFR